MAKRSSGSGKKKTTSRRRSGASGASTVRPSGESGEPVTEPPDEASPEPEYARLHIWQIQAVRDVLVVAAAIGLVWLGYLLRAVTVPLLVALLLAYLFEPVISGLCERRRMSRAAAVASLLACAVSVFLLLLALVAPLVVGQTVRLVDDVRDGVIKSKIARVGEYIPESFRDEFDRYLEILPGTSSANAGLVSAAPTDAESAAAPAEAGQLSERQVRDLVASEVRRLLEDEQAPEDMLSEHWFSIARGGARTTLAIVGAVVAVGLMTFLIPF
ncbi:MAG: AI-2E family transporter, partial [Planctomycetota bacterium]